MKTSLLDELMVHIGEMVIGRNHLTRAFRERNPDLDAIGAMVDALSHSTSELQWHIMQTRLLPVSALTKKLPRLMRDVSRKLGK